MTLRLPEKSLGSLDSNALAFRAHRIFERQAAATDKDPFSKRVVMLAHLHRAYVAAGLAKMHASMNSPTTAKELHSVAFDELFLARDACRLIPRLHGVEPRSVRELIHRPAPGSATQEK